MLKSKGQHITEFALCLVAVVAAFLGMQIYVRRSLQARYRAGVTYLFSSIPQTAQTQYEPYYATSNFTTKYGAGVTVPERWRRQAGPNRESMEAGLRATDTVSERSGWQRLAPAKDAD